MKSIFSILLTAALILSALTAFAHTGVNEAADVRTTPRVTAVTTPRPAAAATPKPIDDGSDGSAVNDRLSDAGKAVGDVVSGAGNAVGSVVNGVGSAVDDAADGMRASRSVPTAVPSTPKR